MDIFSRGMSESHGNGFFYVITANLPDKCEATINTEIELTDF